MQQPLSIKIWLISLPTNKPCLPLKSFLLSFCRSILPSYLHLKFMGDRIQNWLLSNLNFIFEKKTNSWEAKSAEEGR